MSKFFTWFQDEYKGFDNDQFDLMLQVVRDPHWPMTDSLEELSAYLTGRGAAVKYHEALAVVHYHFTFGTRDVIDVSKGWKE